MEQSEENKKIIKLVVISLSVFLLAILISFGYKYLDNQKENSKSKLDQSMKYFIISIPGEDEKTYLVGDKKSKYYELASMDENGYLIGEYKNKVYFSDSNGIYYIDNKNKVSKWIELNQKLSNDTGIVSINKAVFVDNSLYFTLNTPQTGLLKINTKAATFRETKLENPNIQYDNWYITDDKKDIYYLDRTNRSSVNNPYYLNKYNVKNKKTSTISNDAIDMVYDNNYIMYFNKKKNYELHLYNTKTENDIKISDNITDVLDNINSLAVMKDNSVYYYINRVIYRYDIKTNKKEIYYELKNVDDFYNLYFIGDTMVIGRQNNAPIYIKNKKTTKNEDTINIIMKNKETKTIKLENIIK